MIQIRADQLRTLARAGREPFVRKLLRHLRKLFPETLNARADAELREWIQDGVERAEAYGMSMEYDVARFVEYMVYLGPDFDKSVPWAAQILASAHTPGTLKMDLIDHFASRPEIA